MTEPSGWDVSPEKRSSSSGSEPMTPAIPRALWIAFAGHLLVLIAALTESLPPNTAIVAAIACSIIAVAALTELAPPDERGRRAVTALTGGHGVAAAIMLAGVVPSVPWSLPLAGLAAAATGAPGFTPAPRATADARQTNMASIADPLPTPLFINR